MSTSVFGPSENLAKRISRAQYIDKTKSFITCIEIFHDGITIDIRIGVNTSTNKELKCHLKNSGTRVSISIRPYYS